MQGADHQEWYFLVAFAWKWKKEGWPGSDGTLRVFIASSFKRKDVTVQEGRRLIRRPVAERLYIWIGWLRPLGATEKGGFLFVVSLDFDYYISLLNRIERRSGFLRSQYAFNQALTRPHFHDDERGDLQDIYYDVLLRGVGF